MRVLNKAEEVRLMNMISLIDAKFTHFKRFPDPKGDEDVIRQINQVKDFIKSLRVQ